MAVSGQSNNLKNVFQSFWETATKSRETAKATGKKFVGQRQRKWQGEKALLSKPWSVAL